MTTAAHPGATRAGGARSGWTIERGALLGGILVAVFLLGLFHSIVVGAVERSSTRQLKNPPVAEALARVSARSD